MGYLLFWIESLAAALLFLAVITACAAHWPRRYGQRLVPIVVLVLLGLAAGGLTWAIGYFRFHLGIAYMPFISVLVWSVLMLGGGVVLLARGLRSVGDPPVPVARSWSRGKLALALGLVLMLDGITFSNMDLAVKMQLASLRAEAGARTLALLPPRLPDRDNAALLYQQAFEVLPGPETVPDLWKGKEAAWTTYDRAAFDPADKQLREMLGGQERGLALLRQAAALPGCWFEHDHFQSFDMLLPELQRLRQAAMLLAYDALSKAGRGESRPALQDVAAIYGIAGHINEPNLISLLVAAHLDALGNRVLADVLGLTAPLPEDLALLSREDRPHYRNYLHRACRMEEASGGLALFALFSTEASGSGVGTRWLEEEGLPHGLVLLRSPVYRVFLLADDLAAYRRTMQEIQELALRPYHQAHADWVAWDLSLRSRRRGIVTSLIIPAGDHCAANAAEGDAWRQLGRLALALETYRARKGGYPDRLDDLVPDTLPRIPIDPFDGQPLRWKRNGQDLVLYSIGRNLKDDGGVETDELGKKADLVLRLRRR
jgi:hypothetical protein